jgi:hypothetical protein
VQATGGHTKIVAGHHRAPRASLHAQEIDDVLVARDLHLDRAYQRW